MDTAPDFSGKGVTPIIEENYDGNDVKLGNSGRVLRVSDFPSLSSLKGQTLIHTDGATLLGADYAYTVDGDAECLRLHKQ